MSIDPNVQRYLDIMQWFEQHYPHLHDAYWQNICIPSNKNVVLSERNMTTGAIAELLEVIKEFSSSQK